MDDSSLGWCGHAKHMAEDKLIKKISIIVVH